MQPISIITKPAESTQNITFTGNDGACSMEVHSQDVVVSTSAGNHNHGSSKVKLKNVVDFNWEQRFYTGQLLAIHMAGKFLAYAIKVPSTAKPGTWNGMVRVAHRSAERRSLLKGMKGEVQDVAFAHIEHQVVLACIDEEGTIFVFNIELTDDGIRHQLILEVSNEKPDTIAEHRVVWCPYIPDEDEPDTSPEEDGARLLVTTHGNKACMWNVSQLVSKHGAGPHRASAIAEGALTVAEHGAPVVDAAFSPDGTALATASRDGYVMFFQVYMHNESSPRCLHKWQPHGGKPLSYLYFLDNHKNYNVDVQFWKFAVTGAENNTVLKIWSCKSWTCLQTITFALQIGPQLSTDTIFGLKAVLDSGAGYLLLSDFKRRCLYVLQMARDAEDTVAYCKSISEFLLPYPVLSFGIVDAGLQALKCPSSCADPFHQNGAMQSTDGDSPTERDLNVDDMECESISTAVNGSCGTPEGCNVKAVVRLYVVAPKCLQEGRLLFTPPPTSRTSQQCVARHLANLTNDSLGYKDGLTDLSGELDDGNTDTGGADDANVAIPSDMQPLNTILAQQSQQLKNLLMRAQTQPGSLMGQRADSPLSQSAPPQQPLNLMTPDAFSSPAKREEDDPPISATPDVSEQLNMQTTAAPPAVTLPVMVNNGQLVSEVATAFPIDEPPPNICDTKFTSAGSSPSREVQEILSLKGSDCFYEDDLEDELNQSPTDDSSKSKSRLNGAATSESYLFPEGNLFISPENQNGQKSDTSWPQINMAKINEANQRKASSDKSASQSVTNLLNLSAAADVPVGDNDERKQTVSSDDKATRRPDVLSLSQKDRSRLDSISFKLEKLVEIVSDQRSQLAEVRGELTALRRRPSPEPVHQIIEQALQRYQAQTEQTIEQAISRRWESTVESAAQAASESAAAAAARAAATGAARALEPLARGLQSELATKLTVTDHLLRDNIQKLVTSKSVIESLSAAVAQALHGMVRDSFRTAVQQSLVPAVEKAHTQMFKQINAAFQSGTKEFASNTEAAARAAAERGGAAAASHLRAALERHADHLTALPSATELASKLGDVTRTVLEQQMSAFREQANAVMQSRSHTPTSSRGQHTPHQVIDAQVCVPTTASSQHKSCGSKIRTQFPLPYFYQAQQAQVTSLIASGQLNAAFVAALSASDLRLVVHACRTAEPAHVFGPPPALQPHVLLSLVQQLAADMANDTDLKHRYLEEAIMNLEPNNPVTREHMPVVVRELQKQLTTFLSAHPAHPSARRLKMLLMATESLLKPAAL